MGRTSKLYTTNPIHNARISVDRRSLKILSKATTEPLFPNLRHLRCASADDVLPLLHLPFPSLISLDLEALDVSATQNYLESFPSSSPNVRSLFIRLEVFGVTLSGVDFNNIRRWRNLRTLVYPQISLDVNALTSLSRMPMLTRLIDKLSATLPAFDSPLSFSTLHRLTLRSECLALIQRLLS